MNSTHWNQKELVVQENRTEILDASRRVIRDKLIVLPRRSAMVETFATHMAAIAKKLEEDDETGEQRYTYVRSGPDHFSMAFTYNVVAWERGWVSDYQWISWGPRPSPWIPLADLFRQW